MSITESRIAPHSVEAEEAVLGSILINEDVLLDAINLLQAKDFFIIRHEWIYDAMLRLHARREAVDYLTVARELEAYDQLEELGGRAYLMYLINSTPTSINGETYARIVKRFSTRRKLLFAAGEIAELAYDEEREVDDVLDGAVDAVVAVADQNTDRDLRPMPDVMLDYYTVAEARYTNQEQASGVPTGLTDLDRILGGMQKSDLLLVAGRPGMGKSSFLVTVAMNAARYGQRIAFFSLEMSAEQQVQRMIAAETGLDTHKLRMGQVTPDEWERFVEAVDRLSQFNVYLDDTAALPLTQMRTKCRRQRLLTGLDLVVVDYAQLMTSGADVRFTNQTQEIGKVATGLKQIARELNVPVLAAAQLSREVEKRQDKRPILSDLRDSGNLEQDADVVLFLYRDEEYNEDTEKPNIAELIVAKHRNGAKGSVELFFKKELTQFTDLYRRKVDLNEVGIHYAAQEDVA